MNGAGSPWLLLAAVAALAADAHADVLCRKKSGQVMVREQCGRKETPIAPEEIGLVGPPGPTGQAGTAGASGMTVAQVRNASGDVVGIVLATLAERTKVVLSGSGLTVPVQIVFFLGEIEPLLGADYLYYESADCSGTPNIRGGGPLPRGQAIGDMLWYSTAVPETRMLQSRERPADPCGGTTTPRGMCCIPAGFPASSGPATGVALSALGLTPPFTVEPRP